LTEDIKKTDFCTVVKHRAEEEDHIVYWWTVVGSKWCCMVL